MSLDETVKAFLEEVSCTSVLLALSGGADSMVLLECLLPLPEGVRLELFHMEHGIRGEASKRDADFVKNCAKEKNLLLHTVSLNIPYLARLHGRGLEEEARIQRYEHMEKIRRERGISHILLAHHRDDQKETVLMNFLRGSFLLGLAGMEEKKGVFLRPLLGTDKKDILKYAREKKIPYCEDETNSDTAYTRNRIRKTLLPLIEEDFPDAMNQVLRKGEAYREAADFLHTGAESFRKNALLRREDAEILPLDDFLNLHPALRRSVLYETVADLRGGRKDVSYAEIQSLLDYAEGRGGRPSLSGNLQTGIGRSSLYLAKSTLPRHPENSLLYADEEYEIGTSEMDGAICTFVLKYDRITEIPVLREARGEDRITISGDGHTKSVRRLLIDEKVPRWEREGILLLTCGGKIIGIPNLRMDSSWIAGENEQAIVVRIRRKRNGDSN